MCKNRRINPKNITKKIRENIIILSLKLRSAKNLNLNFKKEKISYYKAKQNKYTKNQTKSS